MADFNDSELFAVFDKSNSVEAKKKGAQKRKRVQEPTTDVTSSGKRLKKGPQRFTKVKSPEVVVIDSSDEFEESNVAVKPPTTDRIEKDDTDG